MGIMNLSFPPEPKDIKEFIICLRRNMKGGDDIDYDALAVWYLNKLPKYLWNMWKNSLTQYGYNWQKFLRVMKLHTNDVILWALQDKLSWSELISRIIDTLKRYEKK